MSFLKQPKLSRTLRNLRPARRPEKQMGFQAPVAAWRRLLRLGSGAYSEFAADYLKLNAAESAFHSSRRRGNRD